MRSTKTIYLTQAAMIAAVYVVLTYIFSGISFGQIQVRISEALCVLPIFTPAAVPGLFIGCLCGNLLSGAIPADVIFGSLTTLSAAILSRMICVKLASEKPRLHKWLAPIPPIVLNALVVPLILRFAYGINLPIALLILSVFAGELISCGVLGVPLAIFLNKHAKTLFK